MTALDQIIPRPHLCELERVRVSASAEIAWEKVRNVELAQAPLIRSLFALRSLMMRDRSGASPTIRIDDLRSSADRPGFQILGDVPPRSMPPASAMSRWRSGSARRTRHPGGSFGATSG
jgi:hypothetical protein